MSEQTESIAKLVEALAKAQGAIEGASKDTKNDFFKSKYADLAAVWEACRKPLSDNGLALIQMAENDEFGVSVTTTLAHVSGEWMRSKLHMVPVKRDPQGIGSTISYARRYALAAMVGVYQVDDDANAASGKKGTVTDPRGEPEERLDYDPVERDKYVSRFTDAFNADVEEDKRAEMVFDIHKEISHKHELYMRVGEGLPAKLKNAIRIYVEAHKKSQRAAA